MPPRNYKRKRFGVRSRLTKRRRYNGRRYNRRRTFRRRFTRRNKTFRRFKRMFKGRRKRYRKRTTKNQLEFKLSDARAVVQTFGQQHDVPDEDIEPECVYFTTEVTNTAHTTRAETITRPMGGITDVLNIADQVWQVTPASMATSTNKGWVNDSQWGTLYMKGKDTYEIRNQSNETVKLTAFTCYARKDYNFIHTNVTPNIYNYLGNGWTENGYNVTNADATNEGMTQASLTPFMSRLFCRLYKIARVKQYTIAPGKILKTGLKMNWKKYTPIDMTVTPATASQTAWLSRERRFSTIKGERFILWKLFSNPGGMADQTSLEKNIAQTTPTVIMKTTRRYMAKHLPKPQQPLIFFTGAGLTAAGVTASIIVDADEQKGTEIDAS